MRARRIVLAVLAAAVTLTSVASAGPTAAKQPVTSRLAFTSFPGDHPQALPLTLGTAELYVMNADGSGLRNLTRNLDQKAFGIAWSPAQR